MKLFTHSRFGNTKSVEQTEPSQQNGDHRNLEAGAGGHGLHRRSFLTGLTVVALGGGAASLAKEKQSMYGLIGKMTVTEGHRDKMVAILRQGIDEMPGCLSYIIAKDPADANLIWITEVWDNADSHKASLQLPAVRNAIAQARPMIAGMEMLATTEPVAGHGLVK